VSTLDFHGVVRFLLLLLLEKVFVRENPSLLLLQRCLQLLQVLQLPSSPDFQFHLLLWNLNENRDWILLLLRHLNDSWYSKTNLVSYLILVDST